MAILARKIKKALDEPGEILPYLGRVIGRLLQIKKRQRDGQWYYVYQGHWYPAYLANHAAAEFIIPTAQQYCQGVGIDMGAGECAFPGATEVDNEPDQNAYCLDRFKDESLDYVFSSHCLEHLEQWQEALDLWIQKLKFGGVLFLYLPHESMLLWRPGGLWAGNDHKWSPTAEVVADYLGQVGMEMLVRHDGPDEYWSFYLAARKTI